MPLNTDVIGHSIEPLHHQIDARWLMAYAASLNDLNGAYMDTNASTVVAHPVFPVCVEWPVILELRAQLGESFLTAEEAARGVHAAHDLHLHAPIKDGDTLSTTATMIGVKAIKPGAAYTMKLSTHNQDDVLVAETYQLGIYRGVEVSGNSGFQEVPPAIPDRIDPSDGEQMKIHIPATAAHTYTECARIWNPIHTDKGFALDAGLPDIILHGTATLALSVTEIVNRYANGDPSRVARLGGRFAAMVLMPSTITVQAKAVGNIISYQVLTEDNQTAISNGYVVLSD